MRREIEVLVEQIRTPAYCRPSVSAMLDAIDDFGRQFLLPADLACDYVTIGSICKICKRPRSFTERGVLFFTAAARSYAR